MLVALSPVEGEIPPLLYLDVEQLIALSNSYGIDLTLPSSVSSLARHLFHGGHCFQAPGEQSTFREINLNVEQLWNELNQRHLNPGTAKSQPVAQDALSAVLSEDPY